MGPSSRIFAGMCLAKRSGAVWAGPRRRVEMETGGRAIRIETGFEAHHAGWAHFGVDVRRHIAVGVVLRYYEVSATHVGTNLHRICAAVSRSTTIMAAPQRRHNQPEGAGAFVVERSIGAIRSSVRHRSRDAVRW
jgi:hypothetical protein